MKGDVANSSLVFLMFLYRWVHYVDLWRYLTTGLASFDFLKWCNIIGKLSTFFKESNGKFLSLLLLLWVKIVFFQFCRVVQKICTWCMCTLTPSNLPPMSDNDRQFVSYSGILDDESFFSSLFSESIWPYKLFI